MFQPQFCIMMFQVKAINEEFLVRNLRLLYFTFSSLLMLQRIFHLVSCNDVIAIFKQESYTGSVSQCSRKKKLKADWIALVEENLRWKCQRMSCFVLLRLKFHLRRDSIRIIVISVTVYSYYSTFTSIIQQGNSSIPFIWEWQYHNVIFFIIIHSHSPFSIPLQRWSN